MYRITIEAEGPHHNPSNACDADRLTRAFVRQLENSGHKVTAAQFHQPGVARTWSMLDGKETTNAPAPLETAATTDAAQNGAGDGGPAPADQA